MSKTEGGPAVPGAGQAPDNGVDGSSVMNSKHTEKLHSMTVAVLRFKYLVEPTRQ